MAYVSSTPAFGTGLSLRSLNTAVVAWLERVGERHARTAQIAALHAKTDAELAAMGLTRDKIVAHVFRDRLGL